MNYLLLAALLVFSVTLLLVTWSRRSARELRSRQMDADNRWRIAVNKEQRIQTLMVKVGQRALRIAGDADRAAIPKDDPRRVLLVDQDTLKEARELGLDRIFGLRLEFDQEQFLRDRHQALLARRDFLARHGLRLTDLVKHEDSETGPVHTLRLKPSEADEAHRLGLTAFRCLVIGVDGDAGRIVGSNAVPHSVTPPPQA